MSRAEGGSEDAAPSGSDLSPHPRVPGRRFRAAYAEHRAAEGRGADEETLLALPFLTEGRFAEEWAVRRRTFDRFIETVLEVRVREVAPRQIMVLDVGAGNGWLSYRVELKGQRATALDMRTDSVDGLRAGDPYQEHLSRMFMRVAASFESIPLADGTCDIAVFNASLHYALDLNRALGEIARVVVSGGRVAILDTPFYREATAGAAMVEEKLREAQQRFGDLAEDLTGPPFIEYLTRDRLEEASREFGLVWRRHRIGYPLWYELRPLRARLTGRRAPSRFDLWESTVP